MESPSPAPVVSPDGSVATTPQPLSPPLTATVKDGVVTATAVMDSSRPVHLVPVRTDEVIPYAKKQCKTCNGTGLLMRLVGKERKPDVCGCAFKRFVKKNPDVFQDKKTNAWYRTT